MNQIAQKKKLNPNLINRLDQLEQFIGNTPLYPIQRAYQKKGVEIYAKLEWQQLGNSVKARPAFNILKEAIQANQVNETKGLLDATSGNTGIAYATIGSALGIPITLCLPENATKERKLILQSLGTNLIYTSRFGGTDDAQAKAKSLNISDFDKYYYADQYGNEHNWQAHYYHTAPEIYNQTKGRITHFITGLGTTGTFVGTSRRLKKLNPNIQCISMQPRLAMHGLDGWKHLPTVKVPSIYDDTVADSEATIDTEEAYFWLKKMAEKEGILISPSAAANLAGAIQLAEKIDKGVIVTIFPDNAEKYSEILKQIFSNK